MSLKAPSSHRPSRRQQKGSPCQNGSLCRPLALTLALTLLPLMALPAMGQNISLSEIRSDQPSTDNDEYFELAGPPAASLDGLTYLVLGDGSGGSGTIEAVVDLTGNSIPLSGFFVAAEGTFTLGTANLTTNINLENSDNLTHLLVDGFTGSNGDDLDTDDDGTLDVTPWTQIVDVIAAIEENNPPTGTEFHYGPPTVGPDGNFVPGHIINCPGGWQIALFDPAAGDDTPGAANACPVPATLSEIRIDQPGTDNDEYFELAGAPGTSLDGISYLVLGDGAGGSGVIEAVVDLTGTVIPGSGFFVAAESTFTLGVADLIANINFENSDNLTHLLVSDFTGINGDDLDTNDDGILDLAPWTEAFDCLALIETIGSGELTYCDTSVGPDGNFVPGHSILCPDGWRVAGFDPAAGDDTPGATNICTAPIQLVVNEVDYDQPGTDGAEFVEIKNIGTEAADLTGVELQLINGAGATPYGTFALPSISLPAGGYFVVCGDAANVPLCDLDVSPDTNLIQNGAPEAVALVLGGSILDTVSYEGDVAAPYTEGSGAGLEDPGTSGNDNLGISRCLDGVDSGANNVDFATQPSTPGAANDCLGEAPQLVINEIDYDQDGTDGGEFIEIKNVGGADADLSGVEVQLINGNGGSTYSTIPLPATTLAAGGYFVICGNADLISGCDLDASPDTNLIQNGAPDAVALLFAGVLLDTVSYEGDTAAPFTEGSGVGLLDSSAIDFSGISRFPDGIDTDVNNIDLSPRCVTPGATNSTETTDCANPAPPRLVVNEVDYDQPGGDTGEFVEIHNAGDGAANLGGISLELVNGNGAAPYQTIALPSVELPGGGYFVVCADASTVANCDLEAISSIQNGAPDAVALSQGGTILDTVSYEGDTGAPYTEGSGLDLEDSGASGEDFKGISRVLNGVDTDVNNIDFAFVCITPGTPNTSFTTNCSPLGPAFEIFEIQGNSLASPFAGQGVTTLDNTVTAVSLSGFFIQTPADRADSDPETSEGIFVFTGGAPTVSVGDRVDVTGVVEEFFDLTEITDNPVVTVVSSGNVVPTPITFDAITPSGDQPQSATELERFEGMLVSFDGIATGPSDRFGDVAVVARPSRAFREPGIEFPGLSGLPVWDGNPEVFEIDPDGLGGTDTDVFAGQAVSATGPLTFSFGDYQVLPTVLTLGPAPVLPTLVRQRQPGEFTIATQNMLRFFDDQDDPATDDPVPTTEEFNELVAKFSIHIRGVLDAPDILAVQEVENLNVLQTLAARIQSDDPGLIYTAYLLEGNDVGGIDVGYLVRDTVQVNSVEQFGKDLLLSVDGSLLNDRPPLVLDATYIGGGSNYPITVIGVHQRSLGGIEGSGEVRVRTKRLEQAQRLAEFIQDLQVADPSIHLVVTGDFNAFQFTDGYVDVMGQISGNLDPLGDEFPTTDIVDPNLVNQIFTLPAEERYSFNFGGNSQALDHVLTSASLESSVTGIEFARGSADVPDSFRDDPATALRVSDHDALVLFLRADSDGDGVPDEGDFCADTAIPESVPTRRLLPFHYALTDGDTTFDTQVPRWFPHQPPSFTTQDTGGCSCEQIIDQLHLGNGPKKFGCNLGIMKFWIYLINR